MPLFNLDPIERRETSRELVCLEPGRCPVCGGPTEVSVMGEVPLFRHGGYGAVRQSTTEFCVAPVERCRWSLVREVTEVNPR